MAIAVAIAGAGVLGIVVPLDHLKLIVTALVAAIIYERVGLAVLRWAWVNMDLIWAGALVLTGLLTLLI